MVGLLKGPVLLSLNEQAKGIAIVDGVSLRVDWSGKTERIGGDRRKIFLEMTVTDVLDEAQQRQKIARLEAELANEREKLEGMRAIFNDEGPSHASTRSKPDLLPLSARRQKE